MFITTNDINKSYEVVEIIFAYGNTKKSSNPIEAYSNARESLKNEAEKLEADAVVGSSFNYRDAPKQGCGGPSPIFEVYAYGTAVKFPS